MKRNNQKKEEINCNEILSVNEFNKAIIFNTMPILRGIKNKENNIKVLNQEEPLDRIIFYNKASELDNKRKEKQKILLKKLILTRNIQYSFDHWNKASIKLSNACLNGIYGYLYTQHYTNRI